MSAGRGMSQGVLWASNGPTDMRPSVFALGSTVTCVLEYLEAIGSPANDEGAYGTTTLLQETANYDRRVTTLEAARADFH
jgi:hypothetical protein